MKNIKEKFSFEVVGVLDNIRSLHNVGSMFRTSDGAGIEKLYLCGITPSPIDEFGRVRSQFDKVSLGANKDVFWEKVESINTLLKQLIDEGYFICVVEQSDDAIVYNSWSLPKKFYEIGFCKIAIVVGGEVSGCSPSVLQLADVVLDIPMRGDKESLNVSVAFGIVAYYIMGILYRSIES